MRAVQFPLITKRRTQSTFVRCNKARPTWLGSTMEPDPCLLVIVTCICMYHVLRSAIQLSYQAPPNKSNSYVCTAVLRGWELEAQNQNYGKLAGLNTIFTKGYSIYTAICIIKSGTTVPDSWQGYKEPLYSQHNICLVYTYIRLEQPEK